MDKPENHFIKRRRAPRGVESQTGVRERYQYHYSVKAKVPSGKTEEEPTREEIQDFINEVLGISRVRKQERESNGL